MKKKLIIMLILSVLALCTVLLFACGKNKKQAPTDNEATTSPAPTVDVAVPPESTVVPEESHEGQAKSLLTGTWVPEKLVSKRPYAVMINNISYAGKNHSGLSNASIIYEALVEGGISRMMAIFEDFKDLKKIGSVRSARHCFVSFASEYDAIFVHFGQTKYAVAKMKKLGTNNLSGTEGIGSTVFYRDSKLSAPHNAFASYKGIMQGTKIKKYPTKRKEGQPNHFNFYDEDTNLQAGKEASKVSLKFSSYSNPYFKYNSSDQLYYRYQYGAKHMDVSNQTQLAFKNIIVQYVREWNIDKKGYQTMDIENASGEGYYITNGKAVKITWKKNESSGTMKYYDKTGQELTINPGKTYIGVFPDNRKSDVSIVGNTKGKN